MFALILLVFHGQDAVSPTQLIEGDGGLLAQFKGECISQVLLLESRCLDICHPPALSLTAGDDENRVVCLKCTKCVEDELSDRVAILPQNSVPGLGDSAVLAGDPHAHRMAGVRRPSDGNRVIADKKSHRREVKG
ncbi:MAG: hypothetical protein IKO65_00110 [Victivallales bacterium]|nr:hypothetical protein [Victivallales bacterium]